MLEVINVSSVGASDGLSDFLNISEPLIRTQLICPMKPKMEFYSYPVEILSKLNVDASQSGLAKVFYTRNGERAKSGALIRHDDLVFSGEVGLLQKINVTTAKFSVPNQPTVVNFEITNNNMPRTIAKMKKTKGYKMYRDEETYYMIVRTPAVIRFWENEDELHKLTCNLEMEFDVE